MKTYAEKIERLEQKVRDLERFRDISTGALDVTTGRRLPELLDRYRGTPNTPPPCPETSIETTVSAKEPRHRNPLALTGNPLIHKPGCSTLHIDPATRLPWPCSCGATKFPPPSPSPSQTPSETAQEPCPPGDLAQRLAEHLTGFSDLRHGLCIGPVFRDVVEKRLRGFLVMNEGTELCVGPTTSGRVFVSIPDGNGIRLTATEAVKTRDNLDRAIANIKNERT